MKLIKGDKVKIIAGKDKGKDGEILSLSKKNGKVVVGGINIAKKHVKPGAVSKEGGVISIEKPVDISNVMVICAKCNKPTRVAFTLTEGKKFRICKNCKEVIGSK